MRPVRHLKRINSQQKTGERCDKEGEITTIHNKKPESAATKKVKSQQFTTKTGEQCKEEDEITTIHNKTGERCDKEGENTTIHNKTREQCNKEGEIAIIHNKTNLSNENPGIIADVIIYLLSQQRKTQFSVRHFYYPCKAIILMLLCLCTVKNIYAQSPKREFRAAWIATVSNIDWSTKPGLPARQQKSEFIARLDQM